MSTQVTLGRIGWPSGSRRSIDLSLPYGRQSIAYFDRPGPEVPILFVHGLGNAAANFEEMLDQPALERHRLVGLDLPGCGQSPYPSDGALDIDALVSIVEGFQEAVDLGRHLIVGASMGGLVALLCAEHHPDRLVGFLNAEGNLAPEDCMFSRLVVPHTFEEFNREVFPRIKRELQAQDGRGPAKHLEVLAFANPRAYYDFSFQTVTYSDEGGLLDRFVALPTRCHFVYGSMNRHLSYLSRLRRSACVVTEIEGAGHFLFYDAPERFAIAIAVAAQ